MVLRFSLLIGSFALLVVCSESAGAGSSTLALEYLAIPDSSGSITPQVGPDTSQSVKTPTLTWYSMFENVPGDWVKYSHVAFRNDKLPEWIGIAALTGFLIVVDDDLYQISKGWYDRSHILRQFMYSFDKFGDGRGQFSTVGAFAAYGLLANDKRALRTASQAIQAILAAGTVVQVLKHITGRESPFVSTAPGGVWRWFPNQVDYFNNVPHYDAYPSGHVESSLATVVVIAENYPEVTWIRPVGYTVVGLIGLGMAHTGIHWYSDYPLGIAMGYAFGMIAAHPEGLQIESDDGRSSASFSLLPRIDRSGIGMSFAISF
jgi:hypothetical protein